MTLIRYLVALAVILHGISLHAQLKGKVVESGAKGDTSVVPGAVVLWNNTSDASTSDENGSFSIPMSSQSSKLVVKAIGFEDLSVEIKDSTKFVLLILKKGVDLSEIE